MYQILFALFTTCVVGVLIGFKFSSNIQNPILYILFWGMYFITFLSVLSLLGSLYIFDTIKYKTGPTGKKGPEGEPGIIGETGVCDPKCRDNMCYKELYQYCNQYLNKKYPQNGQQIYISNKYWKDRLTKICGSSEISNLFGVKGRDNVIKYVKGILDVWMDLIYKEGGRTFFETLGAENEFEWRTNNPWNEIKKYDMYYWGMSPIFRIRKFSKCNKPSYKPNEPLIKILDSNYYYPIWGDKYNNGTKHHSFSFWKPQTLVRHGITYYPLGDVFLRIPDSYYQHYSKYNVKGNIEFNSIMTLKGPNYVTKLVSGNVKPPKSAKFVATTKYYKCNYKGPIMRIIRECNSGRHNKAIYLHTFRLIPPKGYVALGDVAIMSENSNPYHDYSKINLGHYRCILEKCVQNHNTNPVIYKKDKCQIHQSVHHEALVGHLFMSSEYGKTIPTRISKGMYSIKEKCTVSDDETLNDDHKHSNKYYEAESKDSKYSVLHYLSIPSVALLVNKGNPKIFIYIRHVKGKAYNHYHIIMHSSDVTLGDEHESLLEAVETNKLKWRRNTIPDKETYLWAINMDKTHYGDINIKSVYHDKYLKAEDNANFKMVHHNSVDKFAWWKIKQ